MGLTGTGGFDSRSVNNSRRGHAKEKMNMSTNAEKCAERIKYNLIYASHETESCKQLPLAVGTEVDFKDFQLGDRKSVV